MLFRSPLNVKNGSWSPKASAKVRHTPLDETQRLSPVNLKAASAKWHNRFETHDWMRQSLSAASSVWSARFHGRSRPIVSIQAAVLNGFGDMAGLNTFEMVEVGQRSGDFENAVVGAGTQAHLRHGMLEMPS